MRTTATTFALLAGVALGGLTAPAFAQNDPTVSDPAVEDPVEEAEISDADIVVTAQRTEQRLQDVPISITVYNQEQLADRNITAATDLATFTPSLSSNDRFGPEKSSFGLRGFNQDANTAPTVGVYFADVVGVRAQGGTTSGNSVGAGSFMDLQNVQILKGPQGTLFGRNTTGGAILLVPQKPKGEFGGYIEGSVGNYDMRRVQGAINLAVRDNFRVRFAADRMVRDGYVRNRARERYGIGPKDYNDRNYFAARLSVVADLTPELENYTIATYSKSDTNGSQGRLLACDPSGLSAAALAPFTPAVSATKLLTGRACAEQIARQAALGDGLYDVEINNPDPFLQIEQWQIINTTTWTINDNLTLKNIVSYGEFRELASFQISNDNYFVPAGGFNAGLVNPALAGVVIPAGTAFQQTLLDRSANEYAAEQATTTEELQIQGNAFDNRLTFVLGGYLEFSRPLGFNSNRTGLFLNCVDVTTYNCANPLRFGSVSESSTQFNFDNHGIFGQGTFDITDQFALTIGGRYTFDKIEGLSRSTRASIVPVGTPGSFVDAATGVNLRRTCNDSFRIRSTFNPQFQNQCRTVLTESSNKPTYLINFDYKPNDDLLFYAKYARGYRQGGISFTNPGVETWGPESIDAYELGMKASFRGAVSGYFNVAGFYNDLTNAQVFAGLVSAASSVAGGNLVINAGKARTKGVEVDASARFFDSLRLSVGYTYLDTEVIEVPTSADLAPRLVGTPFLSAVPTVFPGSPLNFSPKHKFSGTLTYELPVPESIGEMSIGGTLTYTSRQVASSSIPTNLPLIIPNATVAAAVGGTVGGTARPVVAVVDGNLVTLTGAAVQDFVGELPGRMLLNLNFNWDNVAGYPVDLAVFATNITDEKYAVSIGGAFVSSGSADFQLGERRMYGARLRFRFGGDN